MTMLLLAFFLGLGAAVGAAHFYALARDAAFTLQGAAAKAIGLKAARLLLTAGLLAFAAQHGALPLLAATIGFMAARHIVIRRMGFAP